MKYFIPLTFIVVLLISCKNEGEFEKYTYYDNGVIKSKKVFNNKKDTLNYYLESYYANGNVFQSGYFINGKTEGIVKQYNKEGRLISEALFIDGVKNGEQIIYSGNGDIELKNYFENDTLLLRYSYLKEGIKAYAIYEDTPILVGALFNKENKIDETKSYYYTINSNDTLMLNNQYTLELDVFLRGRKDRTIEVELSDQFDGFKNLDEEKIVSDSLRVKFDIYPQKQGYVLLKGIISVLNESKELEKQFYLHKQFYVKTSNSN